MRPGPESRGRSAPSVLLSGLGLAALLAGLFLLTRLADDAAEQEQVLLPSVVWAETADTESGVALLPVPKDSGRASGDDRDDAAPASEKKISLGLEEFLEDDGYEPAYREMPPEDLVREAMILRNRLHEATAPAYQHYYDTGRYEVVGTPEGKYTLTRREGNDLLVSIRRKPAWGEMRKVILSEAEYPGAYALRRRWLFAMRLAGKKQREASKAWAATLQDDD